jgi:leader peptidase (prepilin peptidase)/N-methyltransferase
VFAIGAALGSFLNVIILRYPAEGPLGRSRCLSCARQLTWYELIPIISFVVLRGRCQSCRHNLSLQYPVVELATGLTALILFTPLPVSGYSFVLAVLTLGIVALLIVLFVIDLRTFLLPDIFVVVLAVVVIARLAVQAAHHETQLAPPLWGAIIGAGFLGMLWLVTTGRGIGLGDVKLALPLGALFGPVDTAIFLFCAFIVGGGVAAWLLFMRRVTMKTPIPFGPFLTGVAIVFVLIPAVPAALLSALLGY